MICRAPYCIMSAFLCLVFKSVCMFNDKLLHDQLLSWFAMRSVKLDYTAYIKMMSIAPYTSSCHVVYHIPVICKIYILHPICCTSKAAIIDSTLTAYMTYTFHI
jgi:hypothetical protein